MFPSFIKALIILAIIGVLIWMLTDVLNRQFEKPYLKIVWFLALTFIPVISMIAYYLVVMKKSNDKEGSDCE